MIAALANPLVTVLVTLGLGAAAWAVWPGNPGMFQKTAGISAALSVLWSVILSPDGNLFLIDRATARRGIGRRGAEVAAIFCGVVAVILSAFFLAMRATAVSIDMLRGFPWRIGAMIEFRADGFWTLAALMASVGIAYARTGLPRLATCQLVVTTLALSWACLSGPPLAEGAIGAFERTPQGLVWALGLSGLLWVACIFVGTRIAAASDLRADSTTVQDTPRIVSSGFFLWCSLLALIVGVIVFFHLLVPVRIGGLEARGSAWMATGIAALGATACFQLLRWNRCNVLVDAAMMLGTLSVCGLAVAVIPFSSRALSDRYPMIFNALMIGFGASTALWTQVSLRRPNWLPLTSGGEPIAGHAKRFAFLSASLGLVSGAMMALWPKIPGIASLDHSLGRVTAGFSGNLVLLLALLWCSRRVRRLTFHLLTAMGLVSTAGFMLVRMLPYVSR